MRPGVFVGLLLAAVLAALAPAAPALLRYGSLPTAPGRAMNIVLAGVAPVYPPSAVWPYPAAPEDYTGLTDTIMLAHIEPGGAVHLLSVPRDTWVEIPGRGMSKINAANPYGGPELLMQTLANFTGLEIDGYAFLSLHAVRSVTDAAGGVTIDVPKRMQYDDDAGHLHINLYPGEQRLSGKEMEGFLRFRADAMSDIGRVGRQQQFVQAFAQQMTQPLNLWRWPSVVAALNANTKSNLSRGQVGRLLGAALQGPQVNTYMVPGNFGPHGTWTPDRAALSDLIVREFGTGPAYSGGPDDKRPGQPAARDLRHLSVMVLNVGAPSGSAGRLAKQLEARGFTQLSVGNGEPQNTTTIHGPRAKEVRALLGFGEVDPGPDPSGADLVIRLGPGARSGLHAGVE